MPTIFSSWPRFAAEKRRVTLLESMTDSMGTWGVRNTWEATVIHARMRWVVKQQRCQRRKTSLA